MYVTGNSEKFTTPGEFQHTLSKSCNSTKYVLFRLLENSLMNLITSFRLEGKLGESHQIMRKFPGTAKIIVESQ